MNKQEFMKNLKTSLQWKVEYDELTDILNDYDGFFASGLAEGKSEKQICEELGNTDEIAAQLTAKQSKKIMLLGVKITADTVLGFVLVWLAWLSVVFILWRIDYDVRERAWLFVAFALATCLVLFVVKAKAAVNVATTKKPLNSVLIACHIIIFGFVALDFVTANNFLIEVWCSVIPEQRLDLVYDLTSIRGFVILGIAVAVFAIFGFFRKNPLWFSAVIHSIGAMIATGSFYNILGKVDIAAFDSFDEVKTLFLSPIIFYVATVIATALSAVVIKRMNRGDDDGSPV